MHLNQIVQSRNELIILQSNRRNVLCNRKKSMERCLSLNLFGSLLVEVGRKSCHVTIPKRSSQISSVHLITRKTEINN